MASDAFEDGIDLPIGLLEAAQLSSDAFDPAYPLPSLRITGEEEVRTFRTLILENPFLRVTLLPGLGGRIISFFDKRTGTEILRRHPSILPQPTGRRGAQISEGIQIRLQGEDRLNALGNVASASVAAEEEEDASEAWIAESAHNNGLSFHARFVLPSDRCELIVEIRVLNRTLSPLPYNGELAIYVGEGIYERGVFHSPERNAGLAVIPQDQPLDGLRLDGDFVRAARFAESNVLGPRQADSFTVSLVPHSGLGSLPWVNTEAAIAMDEDWIRVQSTAPRSGHRLMLLTEDGQTLEAPVDLYPEHIVEVPVESLPAKPVAIALQDATKSDVLRSGEDRSILPHADLRRLAFDAGTRPLGLTRLAIAAMQESDWERADRAWEHLLNFNADDPLAWWAKVVCGRKMNADGGERPELPNAHFLAPLEPALRAEAFLSQPMTMGKEPNPLVAPLEENPEEFVEVACLLLEHGLLDDANRWIDEALRHRDLAMLRYLMAFTLLEGTKLDMEASRHVEAAARAEIPPFPWRSIEIRALETIVGRFNDPRASQILQMAKRHAGS